MMISHFHPSQIIKDKERAYYSTPKKYRKNCDLSPHLRYYDINKSACVLSSHNNASFVYTTPIKSVAAAALPDLDRLKRRLMKQPDFNLAHLYHKSSIKSNQQPFK